VVTECLFRQNEAGGNGGAIDAYFPYSGLDPNITSTLELTFDGCTFIENKALTGWGGAMHLRDFVDIIKDCHFLDNMAQSGGAIHMILGDMTITGGKISGNTSIGGGAISYYGSSIRNNLLKNCLVTGNKATVSGGAISSYLYAAPEIHNSTFSNNNAGRRGGAIFCDWTCQPIISNSIFADCSSGAIVEAVGDSGPATIEYSVFYNNGDGDYGLFDNLAGTTTIQTGAEFDTTNKVSDPKFAAGPLGGFYLDQGASPAVNAGSGTSADLGMDSLITDPGGVADFDQVDIGYHYDSLPFAPLYELTIQVLGGNGTVELTGPAPVAEIAPGMYTFSGGTEVTLTAIPAEGYRVATWTALDDEHGWNLNTVNDPKWNVNVLDMALYSNRIVTVEFEPAISRILKVPEEYDTIEEAVFHAHSGDKVFVSQGTHYIMDPNGIDFRRNTIRSVRSGSAAARSRRRS